jgi:sulfite exporter TauE/SafE
MDDGRQEVLFRKANYSVMFYTAIIMGLAGSLHCAGMCSPLAMAMTQNKPFLLSSILYNSGRIFLYGLLGAIAGAFGSVLQLNSYQQVISILLGGLFLLAGFSIYQIRIPFINKTITAFTTYLRKGFGVISNQKSGHATFILGMLNGLLPCGLTYLAMSACLILPSAIDGFFFMLLFGVGTWPVMISSVKLLSHLKNSFSLTKLSKVALIVVGCTLLLRVWFVHPHQAVSIKSATNVEDCK